MRTPVCVNCSPMSILPVWRPLKPLALTKEVLLGFDVVQPLRFKLFRVSLDPEYDRALMAAVARRDDGIDDLPSFGERKTVGKRPIAADRNPVAEQFELCLRVG